MERLQDLEKPSLITKATGLGRLIIGRVQEERAKLKDIAHEFSVAIGMHQPVPPSFEQSNVHQDPSEQ